jgi:hypothetical protein
MSTKLKVLYLTLSATIVGLFTIYGIIPALTPVKEVLIAKQRMEFSGKYMTLKLFSDGSYTFITDYLEIDSITKSIGEYRLAKDTLSFSDKLPGISNRKAILKNNILEFIGKHTDRLIITQTSLKLNSKINYKKHPDFALFAFNPEQPDNYKFDKNSNPYDLVENDISKIIELFNSCPIKRNTLKSENYWKQCIAVINPKGEKEVWLNCACNEPFYFQYGIGHTNDGGSCYMQMKINLTTHSCYDVYYNGY